MNGRLLLKPPLSFRLSQKSSPDIPMKYRLDVPRRDLPLAEMVDSLAAKFDKCSKIVPPKSVAEDDKVGIIFVYLSFIFVCLQLLHRNLAGYVIMLGV